MKLWLGILTSSILAIGCGSDEIDSDEAARRAYLGLDGSIERSLALGFDGFNAATSANIPPQMAAGPAGGTLTITGQVDQGASDNKGMRLRVGMVGYTEGAIEIDGDDIDIVYDTAADAANQPYLQLNLRNIPNGTFTGSLVGDYTMTGDLEGTATLNVTFSGNIMDDGAGNVVRAPGTIMVTGTATTGDGVYNIAVTL
jgi:hypothetical protein